MNVSRKLIHTIAAVTVIAVTLGGVMANPASAEGWRDHDRRAWHEHEWREHDWRWGHPYYAAPSYYYPPPVVYAPPPRAYYAPPPSINFVLPLNLR